MKGLFLLKSITVLMAVLIVVGLCLIVRKIPNFSSKSKENFIGEIQVAADERIIHMSGCGDFVCLLLQGADNHHRIIVVNPKTAKIQNSLSVSVGR